MKPWERFQDAGGMPVNSTGLKPWEKFQKPAPAGFSGSEEPGDFSRGLDAYWPQTKQTVGYAQALAGETLRRAGLDGIGADWRDYGLDVAASNEKILQAQAKPSDQFTNIGSVGDAVDWLQYQGGQAVGNLAESLATAGAGALVGSAAPGAGTVAGALAGGVFKGQVKKELREAGGKLAQQFAKDALKSRAGTGVKVALGAGALTHGLGETTGNVVQEGSTDLSGQRLPDYMTMQGLSNDQLAKVYVGGAAAAGLEYLGDKIGLDTVMKGTGAKGGIRSRALKGAVAVGLKEAGTEVAQTAAQLAGAEQNLTDAAAVNQYINAGAGGFVQGGTIGGAADGGRAALKAVVDKIVGAESGGSATAKNKLSSAEGAGQFIDSTWLAMLKKHRPDIVQGKSEAQLLALKTNKDLSVEITTRYAEDNAASLQADGFEPTARNVYLSHHFGDGGAKQLLRADPSAPVADVVKPEVISQNPYMRGKTVQQVLDIIGGKMGDKAGQKVAAVAGVDAGLSAALADVQPEPMADYSLDDANARYEAELQAEMGDNSLIDDEYARMEREAIQYEGGSQIDVGNEVGGKVSPEQAAIVAENRRDSDGLIADVPFSDNNPYVGREPPAGLKGRARTAWFQQERGRKLQWEVENGYHPAVDPQADTDSVPFSRKLPDQVGSVGTMQQVAWKPSPVQQDAAILSEAVTGALQGKRARFEQMQAPVEFAPVVDVMQRAFQKRVVFVRGDADSRNLFNGAIFPSKAKNRIFVNVDSNTGYMNVVGHELYEHLLRDRPDLHQWFTQQAAQHLRNTGKYQQRLNQSGGERLSLSDAEKELLADFTGDALADPAFLRGLAADHPGKFRQFVGGVLKWLDTLLSIVQGQRDSGSAAFVRDVQGLRDKLRAALVDYANGQAAEQKNAATMNADGKPDTPDIAFMRRIPETPEQAEKTFTAIAMNIARQWADTANNKLGQKLHDLYLKGGNYALYMMSFNGLVDRYGPLFSRIKGNPLKALEDYKRMMRAVTMHWAERFQRAHDRFTALSREGRRRVSMMMYDATMLNMHPDQDYKASISIKWAKDRIAGLEADLRAIERDQMRKPENRMYDEKQALQETMKAQRGIESLQRRIEHEQKRAAAIPQIERQWAALSQAEKDVYTLWRKELEALWEKQTKALEDKLAEMRGLSPEDAKLARGMVAQLRLDYRKRLELGPYFPLRRYGKHMVLVRENGTYERTHFESHSEAQNFIKSVRADRPGAKVLYLTDYKDKLSSTAKDVPGIAGKLLGIINQQSGDVDPAVREAVNRFIIESLPEVSARKAEFRRYYVAGADKDMERGFAHTILHGGHDLSRIMFGHKVQDAVQAMSDAIQAHEDLQRGAYAHEPLKEQAAKEVAAQMDEDQLPLAGDVLQVVRKQVDRMMNPDTHPIAAMMGNFAFFWYLAGSPVAGLLNLVQTAQVTFPVLASRFGASEAGRELTVAIKDVIRAARRPEDVRTGVFATSDDERLPEDERLMLKALELDGTTDVTQANSLASVASGDGKAGVSDFALKADKAFAYLGWFFHNAEIINRQATQLAAYRLYKRADAGTRAALDREHGQQGVGYARWMTERTHFDYSHSNRSLFLKGNVQKGIFPLKNYSFLMIEFLTTRAKDAWKHEDQDTQDYARKELAYTLGMTALFSGMSGLPLMWLLFGMANLANEGKCLVSDGSSCESGFDSTAAWAAFLDDALGQTGREMVLRGPVNALTGIDLSGRVGLGNLVLNGPSVYETGGDAVESMLVEMLGVVPSTAVQFGQGMELLEQGEYQKAVEKFMPKFLRDMSKAERYATEGLTTKKHDEMIAPGEFNAGEIFAQSMGFAPASVTRAYDERERLTAVKENLEGRREQLMNDIRWYHLDGRGSLPEIEQRIARFNRVNPELAITRKKVAESVKRARAARLKKEATGGMYLNDSMRKQLQQHGYL